MKVVALLFLILGVSACGSNGGGGAGGGIPGAGLPALTEGQQERMATVNSEASEISATSEQYGPQTSNMDTGSFNPFEPPSQGNASPSSTGNNSLEKKKWKLDNELQKAMWNGECVVDVLSAPGQRLAPMETKEGFILGDSKSSFTKCPIRYKDVTVSSTVETANGMTVDTNSDVEFGVNENHELIEVLDVIAFNFTGKTKVVTAAKSETSFNFTMNANGQGELTSQSEGRISIDMKMGGTITMSMDPESGQTSASTSMRMTTKIQFSDFTAVGYAVIDEKVSGYDKETNSKFYINGKEVTEEEFNNVFQHETETTSDKALRFISR